MLLSILNSRFSYYNNIASSFSRGLAIGLKGFYSTTLFTTTPTYNIPYISYT